MGQATRKQFIFGLFLAALFLFFPQSVNAYTGGYVFPLSAKQGESVGLHLSTTAPSTKIEIFRQGVVQEKVAEINNLVGSYLPCEHHSEIGCFSPKVYSLNLTEDYKPGLYLAKFINQQDLNEEDLAYFVVKPKVLGSWSKIAVILPINTWEVHNYREGKKVYPSPYEPGYENRARSGSFLRPWLDICSNLELGYPIGGPAYIWWLESQGYFPEYITDVDLDKYPDILNNYKVGISIAHHEYWSWGMRDAVENYTAAGGNFMFLSGNVSWWQVRYDNNYSLIRVYKIKEEDPYYLDGDPSNDKYVTVNWYDEPVFRPETLMTSTSWLYGGFWEPAPVSYDSVHIPGFTVYRTNDPKWNWVFANTGLKDGQLIGQGMFLQNIENDGTLLTYNNGLPIATNTAQTKTPGNFTILGVSDITRRGAAYGHAVMGIRETAGGGVIFTGSQQYFVGGLMARDSGVEKIVLNLLEKLSPGEQKSKANLPYSSGGLKVFAFDPPLANAEFDVQLESALCSMNSGHSQYWAWVLADNTEDTGSYYYSLGQESGWFSLKPSTGIPWTIITDSETGWVKEFTLESNNAYHFKIWPRTATAKIKKIIFTNTQYFYPPRFEFDENKMPVVNLPPQQIIDPQPQFTAINPNGDSYLYSWYPNTNYGSSSNLKIKNDGVNKTLINFDLSFIPNGATINRAFLKILLADNSNNSPVNVGVALIKKNWMEKEVNWQQAKNSLFWQTSGVVGQDDNLSSPVTIETVNTKNNWYYFDVTEHLKEYSQNPSDFKGFLLFPTGNNPVSTYLTFFSREAPSSSRPVLEINYILETITPTATPATSLTPSPTPTPTSVSSVCQPTGETTSFFLQDGSLMADLPFESWQPDSGQVFSLTEPIKLEEIRIKVKNKGNGSKLALMTLTFQEGKKLVSNQPSPLIIQKSGIVPGFLFNGWMGFAGLSQDNVFLQKNIPYFVWLKDGNGYSAFSWTKSSLEVKGKKCLDGQITPSLTPTPTPTTILPTATPPVIVPTPGETATVTLQATKDTYDYLYDATDYCSANSLKVGYKQQNSALFRYDLSSIPNGATITDAKFQIYASGWGGQNISIGIYKVFGDWSCAIANPVSRDTASMSTVTTSDIAQWYEFNLTPAMVQDWISNPASNFGVSLNQTDMVESSYSFSSSEASANFRPKLTVAYRQ